MHQERQTALQAALGQLSAGEQLLFYRKYYYLPSTAQIALELGLTERAVEGRLYRLKRQLRKLPGGDEGAEGGLGLSERKGLRGRIAGQRTGAPAG